jgi:cytochrome c553
VTQLPLLLLLAAVAAAGSEGAPSRGETLAAACNACHGADGRGSPPIPPLRGRSDLQPRLQAWKSAPEASGEAHLMIRLSRSLSPADIDALAAFYARQDAP